MTCRVPLLVELELPSSSNEVADCGLRQVAKTITSGEAKSCLTNSRPMPREALTEGERVHVQGRSGIESQLTQLQPR